MAAPKEQLLSRTVYDTDGTTTIWEFAFSGGYLDPAHVKAYTENAVGTRTDLAINPATDLVGQFQLRVQPALAAGLELVIYRDTPKNLPLVDFTDESGFSEIALDTNAKQGVFIAAEAIDTVNALDVAAAIDAAERAGIAAVSAQASQGAAASSENAAANSAAAAANSASASQSARLAAESARNVASTEAAAAAVSATSANTSRTQAQDSATAAANSATAANTSATAASASQTAAANSATAAAGSATSASASQTAAANSATAAANSATAAAGSATSAATSADAAAASAASVNAANLVQVTGDQTIGGIKTFSSAPRFPNRVDLNGATTAYIINAIDAQWGLLYKPSQDGTFAAHGWLNNAGDAVARLTGAGHLIATGNITAGGQFLGNGAGLTNVPASAIAGALNASGSAPIYACRAWVNFNGTGTVAIRASGNVSSITDNGTGIYTVNFTTAMPDVNFAVFALASDDNVTNTAVSLNSAESLTLTSARINTYNSSVGSAGQRDPVKVCVSVFR